MTNAVSIVDPLSQKCGRMLKKSLKKYKLEIPTSVNRVWFVDIESDEIETDNKEFVWNSLREAGKLLASRKVTNTQQNWREETMREFHIGKQYLYMKL